mmetsp:Transcript_24437/g.35729  ORF Transcript_24437/g.35729 Transcript_24437/m.35729 type:complete len:619 (+) Transcript_24437:142-1998(+)|eukprot:CAMPEP_0195518116 /NCGR_PEP_ID=MMETSP0794_2-20130614/12288_1 /TAXON_ID=515487 /ORGANISM="Stephanopyxis turris, Strain CCMP 815" /LENGTH=618 /DNA_ID=CAMNT_0040647033 /DNA_START=138 /DNA_END=1994 /DNA_ORIENTATION=+
MRFNGGTLAVIVLSLNSQCETSHGAFHHGVPSRSRLIHGNHRHQTHHGRNREVLTLDAAVLTAEEIAQNYQKAKAGGAPLDIDMSPPSIVTPAPLEVVVNSSPPPPAPTSVADSMDVLTSQTMEAAEKATTAASELAAATSNAAGEKALLLTDFLKSSSSSMIKETAATASAGKSFVLSEYLRQNLEQTKQSMDVSKLVVTPTSDSDMVNPLENAGKGLSVMKENLFSGLSGSVSMPAVSLPAVKGFAATAATGSAIDMDGIKNALNNMSLDTSGAMETLHLKEYGAWYITAAAIFVAASQRNAGKEAAREEFEKELAIAREKADEAAFAANTAVEGALQAKKLAETTVVAEGEQTVSVLAQSRTEEMRVEKEMMKKEMQRLKQETQLLKAQLDSLMPKSQPHSPPVKAPIAPAQDAGLQEPDPAEKGRILKAIKEIDDANKKATTKKPAKATTTTKKAPPKKKQATKKPTAAKEQQQQQEQKKKVTAAAKAKQVAQQEAEEKAAKEKAEAAATEKAAKAAATKRATAAQARINKATAAAAAPPANKKSSVTTTKKSTKVIEVTGSSHPWASLAPSTLGRKTVKDLSAFLTEKGVTPTNEEGKALPKKILLEKVKSFL